MIQRSLNKVDKRLLDHGLKVAFIMDAMLREMPMGMGFDKDSVLLISMLHDIGAYRTDEIDRLVGFETDNVWEHSIYGYLFLRELSPAGDLARIVLYHHMDYKDFGDKRGDVEKCAQFLHVADRADILVTYSEKWNSTELENYFKSRRGANFSPEAVEAFLKAEKAGSVIERIKAGIEVGDVFKKSGYLDNQSIKYLETLIYSIDFRSRHTVIHTVAAMHISRLIAELYGMDENEAENVYYGTMLHDIGKIGIPADILEKPGRLTDEEMEIMKTHVAMTEEILDGCAGQEIVNIASRHHEKLGGNGYHKGLCAGELSKCERIAAVSDVISALCGVRSYKAAFPKEKVFEVLSGMCGKGLLDKDIVEIALNNFDYITDEAGKYSKPVIDAYEKINGEYAELLKKFSRASR